MSQDDATVITPTRILSDPAKGPQYVIAYEGTPVKVSTLRMLGLEIPGAPAPARAAGEPRGSSSKVRGGVEDKSIAPPADPEE